MMRSSFDYEQIKVYFCLFRGGDSDNSDSSNESSFQENSRSMKAMKRKEDKFFEAQFRKRRRVSYSHSGGL